MLDDFYFADPRLVLIPLEGLGPDGVDPGFAATLRARCGWPESWIDLLDEGFALYWERLGALARRGRDLSPPRLRNVGVVTDPDAVRPFASILNTSTWTLYASDLDPERSDAELVAYLLAHGDRMTETGEVTLAAVHLAGWWFERSADERQAFAAAAAGCGGGARAATAAHRRSRGRSRRRDAATRAPPRRMPAARRRYARTTSPRGGPPRA